MPIDNNHFETLRNLILDVKVDMRTGHNKLEETQERIWQRMTDDLEKANLRDTDFEARLSRVEQTLKVLGYVWTGLLAIVGIIEAAVRHK